MNTQTATEAELFAAHLDDAVGFATGCFRIPGMSRDEIAQTARLALLRRPRHRLHAPGGREARPTHLRF